MAVALETFVKHLTDSGVIAPGKLENFIPPKATPKDAQELARQLVQSKHLTKYQAQEIYQGRAKSLILGNYTILDKIGAGGMGQVFKAEHRRMKRVVAIKVLPRSVTKDAAAAARFQREVEAAAKLEHPNIVTAHDADEADGTHFLVMQCVDGQDLSALVKKNGPFSVSKAVNYILQSARGLEYAHKNGVIHRDIKPGNLLLNAEGTVKILDMGLARIEAGGDAATQAELTGTGAIMGTVDYMAPEQALSTKHADARADIYSLGCTLFYLLTGKPIYDGETLTAKLIGHQTQPIPELRKVCSQAPAELATVFQRMVAKKIEDRYQTMSEVVAALESCLVALRTGSNPATAAIRVPDSGNFNPLDKPATTARAADRTAVYTPSTQADAAKATGVSRRRTLAIGAGLLAVALTVVSIVLIKAQGPEPIVDDQQPPALSQTASPQGVARTTGAPDRVERQFVDLFNGHDLAGWHPVGDPELWQVDATEGVLTATGAGLGWMLNDRDFGDFFLRLEYQHAPDANSGLALFVVYPLDSDFLEVQIGNIAGYATGGLWSNPTNHTNGGFLRAARPAQEKPADQWNQLEVELRERRLTVNLNGSEVSRFDLEQLAKEPGAFPPITRATGRIALQSQAGRVRFRKIQLATAPAHEPITTYTTAAFKQWEANVAALAPEDQVDAVRQKLMELNPGFDGKENHQVEGGAVTKIYFDSDQVTDLSPLRALKYLGLLHCSGSGTRAGKLADLSPLQGMKIGHLYCGNTQISDLSPLVGMPLTILSCDRTQIASLKPLEGMKLISFSCWLTPVADLSPLRGMPLTSLGCFASPVSDLSPLRGMKLTALNTCWTAVSDLSPLAGMPLTLLHINGTLVTDLTPLQGMELNEAKLTPQNIKKGMKYLREMNTLEAIGIGDKPDEQFTPAEFWKKYDAGDFGKSDSAAASMKSSSDSAAAGPAPARAPFDSKKASAHQRAWAKYLGLPVEYTDSIGMKFALIPPGQYQMGTGEEELPKLLEMVAREGEGWESAAFATETPQHLVRITRPYYLGKYEVTDGQFQQFAASGNAPGGKASTPPADAQMPVGGITYEQMTEFCQWLGQREQARYRLPTEAEWEYACRAGTTTPFAFGDSLSSTQANFNGEFPFGGGQKGPNRNGSTKIGSFAPNAWGLYDMHGNLWEICSDWHAADAYEHREVNDPTGPATGTMHVLRGGDFEQSRGFAVRSATRLPYTPPYFSLGFRVVREIPWPKSSAIGLAPPPAKAPFDAKQARAHQKAWAKHLGTEVQSTNSIGMKLVLIPPGEFMMGSTDEQVEAAIKKSIELGEGSWAQERIRIAERPPHKVVLTKPLAMSATEVTIGQFRPFIAGSKYVTLAEKLGGGSGGGPETTKPGDTKYNWQSPGYAVDDDWPVTQVSRADAAAFCNWLCEQEKLPPSYRHDDRDGWVLLPAATGYRLPTEAQWEYACRAGTTTQYWFGDDLAKLSEYAWFDQNSVGSARAVGLKPANPFGLYDMHGNVAEWCADRLDNSWYSASPPNDPDGPPAGERRVIRGGNWRNVASTCRSASRDNNLFGPTDRGSYLGFRVVRTLESTPGAAGAATAEQGKPSTKPASLAGLKEVDLLKLLDPKKHARNGDWTSEGEALVTPKELHFSLLEIPYSPPEAYDLELVAQPIADKKGLVIGLAAGTIRVEVGIDCYDGEISGLALIDGNTAVNNGTAHRGTVFANQSVNTILCAVRHNRIVVTCAGKTIVDWHGDFNRLSLFEKWQLEPGRNLFIGSHNSFRISRMVLRPIAAFNEPAFDIWIKEVAALPAEEQVKAVSKKLQELNPGFDGKVAGWELLGRVTHDKPQIEDGKVTEFGLVIDNVTDLSPLQALTGLAKLKCKGSGSPHGKLSDLSPLKGLQLRCLDCSNSAVSDLTPLRGMPLTILACTDTDVSDLSALKGMPLVELWAGSSPIADLSPLKNMPLRQLAFDRTRVSDLSPLQGMSLERIYFTSTDIANGMVAIRKMRSLTAIGTTGGNPLPPDDFWRKYDAGEFGKPAKP